MNVTNARAQSQSKAGAGAIDCDLHPVVPNLQVLLPYLEDHWRDMVVQRGVHELDSIGYPTNAPLSSRPDWRHESNRAGTKVEAMAREALDVFGSAHGILNPLYGAHLIFSEDMAAGFCRAINEWVRQEWLDRDPRLAASIVVPAQSPDLAVAEIERCAMDRRFVQVLLMVSGEVPLGRRQHWPIYETAQRLKLPIGIHAGSSYRHPVTPVGWPSYVSEDYASQATAFQSALTSLVCEGVFSKFPHLRVVLIESGFTWLASYLWRLTKYWRGLRMEIPWVDRPPIDIVRERVRLTLQPVDAPPEAVQLTKLFEHLGSDELILFSTDYPHWQFDGTDVLPRGLPEALKRKIMVENPAATYGRLNGEAAS
jgi:uncharacterized protein